MTKRSILAACAAVALAGCASQISQQTNATLVRQGVGPATIVKMQNGDGLDYGDILDLVKRGVPTNTIIGYLQSTGRVYNFGPVQLKALAQAGAPPQLVNYLQETQGFYGRAPAAHRGPAGNQPAGAYYNSPLYQDEQPFAYNQPMVDDWYDSAYEESLYSPFSYN